jgi:hypothetical protein
LSIGKHDPKVPILTLRTTLLIHLRVAGGEAYASAFTVICRESFHTMSCMELRQLLGIHSTTLQRKLRRYGLLVSPHLWTGCSDEDNLSATKKPVTSWSVESILPLNQKTGGLALFN